MEKINNIEQQAADVILQKRISVRIGDNVYQAAPASTATLILVSELVAKLPAIRLDDSNVLIEALRIAKDCRVLGDIVAVLILGAKGLKEERIVVKKKIFGLYEKQRMIVIDKQAELADKILKDLSPSALSKLTINLLSSMEVGDFFGLTTSLLEVNLLRKTREVETTASGPL